MKGDDNLTREHKRIGACLVGSFKWAQGREGSPETSVRSVLAMFCILLVSGRERSGPFGKLK